MTAGIIQSRAIGDAIAAEALAWRLGPDQTGRAVSICTGIADPHPDIQSPLFNPSLNYVYFLLAALIPAILQIFICATSAYSVGLERRSAASMQVLTRLGGGLAPAMFGKALPYTLAFSATMWIADATLFGYFDAPFRGDWRVLFAAGVLLIVAYQLVGALFSLVGRDLVQSLGFAGIYTAPSFGFIGVSFPRAAMGAFAKFWGALLPVTWFMQIRIDQTLRGAPAAESLRPLGYLVLTVAILTAAVVLRLLQLRKMRWRRRIYQGGDGMTPLLRVFRIEFRRIFTDAGALPPWSWPSSFTRSSIRSPISTKRCGACRWSSTMTAAQPAGS